MRPMIATRIETPRLTLVELSPDECQRQLAAMPAEHRAELSEEWLARVAAARPGDVWLLGFSVVRRADGAVVGSCGFKGPPSREGVVEIAYAIEPDEQGKGYATEAAQGLVDFALRAERVRTVCAHTLPIHDASPRVLAKCGFRNAGEIEDPDDGLVWRWEIAAE